MFFLYQVIISLLLLLSPIIILIRIFNKKESINRFQEKFSFSNQQRTKGKLIWFHGASVGEIMSIIPLIQRYEKEKSISQILITSSTLSSSKILKKYNFKKTTHQFYPIDHIYFTNKFLNYWKPSIVFFIESEIWPCMFQNLKRKKIPLILLNARLTKKTFKRWYKINFFTSSIFKNILVAFPQNLETRFFLKKFNVKKINLIGNLKFIESRDNSLSKINNNLKKEFKKRKVWIASSTHRGEELFCIYAHIKLKKEISNLTTIIIPRHIHRSNEIIKEVEKLDLKYVCHSSQPKSLNQTDIYVVDTFGETEKFHNLASTVFLGGSIINRGGQNPLEAARLGAKIVHGPNTDNFKDIYKLLKSFKISKKINTPAQLASVVRFKKNKANGNKIKNIGEKILKKTIKELDYLIKNEFKKT